MRNSILPIRRRRSLRVALAALLLGLPSSQAVAQNARTDTGYNALSTILGGSLPTGSGVAVTQIEAKLAGNNRPSITSSGTGTFSGVTFGFRSPITSVSSHAVTVGNNLYGDTLSFTPGITSVDSYDADHWLTSGILRTGEANVVPNATLNLSRVANHSYVGALSDQVPFSVSEVLDVLQRVDYLVERDDLINVVGMNNGANINTGSAIGNNTATLLSYASNTISVGVSSLYHVNGTPASLGPDPVYGSATDPMTGYYEHQRPDLVAPAAATSYATPLVSSAAALLIDASRAHGPTSGTPWSTISYSVRYNTSPGIKYKVYAADTSEVIRAALMAGADRTFFNTDGVKAIDYRATGALQSANGLDRRYGAGQLNVRNSYDVLAGMQHAVTDQANPNVLDLANPIIGVAIVPVTGFDYDQSFGGDNGSNSIARYNFTGSWTGQNLAASLVWNVGIDNDQFSSYDPAPALYDLNLRLWDVTNPSSPLLVAASLSDHENTENIFTQLTAGRNYQLEVSTPDAGTFEWDYGLAWNGSSNQVWLGIGSNPWDINSTANWQRGNNTSTKFLDNDQVVFTDLAANKNVNITTPVSPDLITVNSTADYTFSGSAITGTGGLFKQGTGTLFLNNANTYSGDTLLQTGAIRAGAANAFSPNSPVDLAAGTTLDLQGFANTVKQLTGTGTVQATGAVLGVAPTGSATFAGTLVAPATLNKTQTGMQEFAGNLQWQASNINVQAGTLRFNLSNPSTVSLTAGTNVAVQAGATLELAGTKSAFSNGTLHAPIITNAANANVSVVGTNQVVGALTGPVTGPLPLGSAVGATTVATGANLTAARIRQSSLTINGTGQVTIAPNGGNAGTSMLAALSISPTGQLDLKDNDLLVDNGNLAAITNLVKSGLNINGSLWTGPGITSSTAAANPLLPLALGVIPNNDGGGSPLYPTFNGISSDINDVLVKYTFFGDADLNGIVDTASDFDLYITGLTSGGSLGGWLYGDFDYNGVVDSTTDFDLFITGLTNQSGGPLLTANLQSELQGRAAFAVAAIPEPSTWAALVGVGLLGMRLKRKKPAAA